MSEVRDSSRRGTIFYDAECAFCSSLARRFARIFGRCGFAFLPLQTPCAIERLGLQPGAPLQEMRVLTSAGEDLGGGEAIVYLARQVWWMWPLFAVAKFPGMRAIIDRAYQWIAAHRACRAPACAVAPQPAWSDWGALVVLPTLALFARNHLPAWAFMWLMCGAIFFGCKWLTFRQARSDRTRSRGRVLAYFFAWPGMDAEKNFRPVSQRPPAARAPILFAIAKTFFGALLFFGIARFAASPLLSGWIGMFGLIFILHFGLFHLLAIAWRAEPIMKAPWRAKSLGEFWGRRWNGAFNQLAFAHVFRPLARSLGVAGATLAVFLVSGLVHELVISLPARGGYGLPTLYFLIQGGGILAQRSMPRLRGRAFTLLVTASPAFWLFHPPFVRGVVIPFMKAMGAL